MNHPYRRLLTATILLLAVSSSARAQGSKGVKLEQRDNHVAVTIDGKPFTDYYFAAEGERKYVRPFFYPVKAADGTEVTSDQSQTEKGDHPHHRSIWVAQGDVNGVDHWAFVKNPEARQTHLKFEKVEGDTVVETLQWTTGDGKAGLLEERRTIRFAALPDGSRAIDIKSVYHSTDK